MSENIGEYNRKVAIQRNVGAKDSLNQPIDAWTQTVFDGWAKIRGQSGMSIIKAGNDVDTPIERVSIRVLRYLVDVVQVGDRVVMGTEVFYVRRVSPDHSGKEFTDFVCDNRSSAP